MFLYKAVKKNILYLIYLHKICRQEVLPVSSRGGFLASLRHRSRLNSCISAFVRSIAKEAIFGFTKSFVSLIYFSKVCSPTLEGAGIFKGYIVAITSEIFLPSAVVLNPYCFLKFRHTLLLKLGSGLFGYGGVCFPASNHILYVKGSCPCVNSSVVVLMKWLHSMSSIDFGFFLVASFCIGLGENPVYLGSLFFMRFSRSSMVFVGRLPSNCGLTDSIVVQCP